MNRYVIVHAVVDLLVLLVVYVVGYVRGWHVGRKETEVRWSEAVYRKEHADDSYS